MAERKRRARDLVEESRFWNAQDMLRNLEEEMERLERGLGHIIFDAEGKPVTRCVSPLPMTPKFEAKDEGETFRLKVNLPGVEKEDIRLFVERRSIEARAVSGQRICRPYYVIVDSPWDLDPENAEVKFEDGVLTVRAKRLKKTRVAVQ